MHEMYAGIPPVLAGYTNDEVCDAYMRLQAAMLEAQRQACGHYKRRPTPTSRKNGNGFIARYYQRTYGDWTPEQIEAAVALAHEVGTREAARRLKIPKSTVSDWVNGGPQEDGDCPKCTLEVQDSDPAGTP